MPPSFEECGRALSVAHVRASVRPSFKWVLCEHNENVCTSVRFTKKGSKKMVAKDGTAQTDVKSLF